MQEIKQLSQRGESICIELRSSFVVLIDLAYYSPFKRNEKLTQKENIIEHLKANFPFASLDLIDVIQLDDFKKGKYTLDVDSIKSNYDFFNEEDNKEPIFEESKGYFGLDTATILIIDFEDLELFTKTMYDGLEENCRNNEDLISKMNDIINYKSFAIIECPGIESKYDFIGDGSYFIEKKAFKKV